MQHSPVASTIAPINWAAISHMLDFCVDFHEIQKVVRVVLILLRMRSRNKLPDVVVEPREPACEQLTDQMQNEKNHSLIEGIGRRLTSAEKRCARADRHIHAPSLIFGSPTYLAERLCRKIQESTQQHGAEGTSDCTDRCKLQPLFRFSCLAISWKACWWTCVKGRI